MPLSSPIMRGMDQDERADYQKYMEEVRRHAEEEAERYRAAHPPQTACSVHPERAIAGYVYVKRGNLWPKDARCAECMEAAESLALSAAISKAKDNVHYMGNPFGTEKWEHTRDANGNIIDSVRII